MALTDFQVSIEYLPKHLVKQWRKYDSMLAQATENYNENDDSPTRQMNDHRKKGCGKKNVDSLIVHDHVLIHLDQI